MSLVLEGPMGCGKTTLAHRLAMQLGWPVYRPFRVENTHEHDDRARSLGVPVNTWVEDIYVADMISALGCSVVLDRSMLSGVVWNNPGGAYWANMAERLVYWCERMSHATVLALHAPHPILQQRSHRAAEWEATKFAKVVEFVRGLSVAPRIVLVDTSLASPAEIVSTLCERHL